MELSTLTAISPLDGRYYHQVNSLQAIFSEYGLMRFRFIVELHWLQALCTEPKIAQGKKLTPKINKLIEQWISHFSIEDAKRIKELEKITNHDAKAVEYFIKEKMAENAELKPLQEMVHFACTSEDINNLAYGLMLKEYRTRHLLIAIDDLIQTLTDFARRFSDTPMLARTHGQVATPTTFGKEMANVVARLKRQQQQIETLPILGKFNGAVGNFNAHYFAYPEVDWLALTESMITNVGLTPNQCTTQIEPHDYLAEWCHAISRVNTILIDFCRDMWGYISLGYISLKKVEQEVGSSTMPHKINPIDFENAEGNFGIANALLQHLASHLPISRWQRDLSDSTQLRNLGSAMAYCQIAYTSCLRGLSKITADTAAMQQDLDQHWEVLAEALQTVMRRYGVENPYEQLKALSRGKQLDRTSLKEFIKTSDLPEEAKKTLLQLTPDRYLGIASELARKVES